MTNTSDAEILELDLDSYFRDLAYDKPSLSQSTAHILLTQSPRHAFHSHPRLGGAKRTYTKETDNGSLVHALLLGSGPEIVAVNADDWRTKAAKEARDESRAAGKIPVLAHALDTAMRVKDILNGRLLEHGVELSGSSELMIGWKETATDGERVQCRAMLDHFLLDACTIYDLKTISSAHPDKCARSAVEYGYGLQQSAYRSAIRHLYPDLAGREKFVFLFVETEAPYDVTPIECDGVMRELGDRQWQRAVDLWAKCLTSGWPGYVRPGSRAVMTLPPWALSKEMGAQP